MNPTFFEAVHEKLFAHETASDEEGVEQIAIANQLFFMPEQIVEAYAEFGLSVALNKGEVGPAEKSGWLFANPIWTNKIFMVARATFVVIVNHPNHSNGAFDGFKRGNRFELVNI